MKTFKITPVWCGRAYYASVCFSCGGGVISCILYTGCFRARKENVPLMEMFRGITDITIRLQINKGMKKENVKHAQLS